MTKTEAQDRLNVIKSEEQKLLEIINDSVFDRVLTIEDVCIESGTTLEQFNSKHVDLDDHVRAYMLLVMTAKVFNEGWTPDWNNSSEYKYYPWFKMGAGFDFAGTAYVYAATRTYSASRLCFKDEKTAEHAGRTFLDIYRTYLS